jgi:hypothetical protein
MGKYARLYIECEDGARQFIDVPISEGNTFPNLMMQIRMQGYYLDGQINVYVPLDQIKMAFQIEQASTAGMTRQ